MTFEYKIEAIEYGNNNEPLNALGAQGWELVAAVGDSGCRIVQSYFKRPVAPVEVLTEDQYEAEYRLREQHREKEAEIWKARKDHIIGRTFTCPDCGHATKVESVSKWSTVT